MTQMNNQVYSTLIIDDEPPARERLSQLLKNFPETFHVIGTAENGSQAKQQIERLQPDLIFLDIQMPGLTGFEILEKLDKIPFVVFCTAYDQYSLKAFETNCLDYLIKPVRIERLEQTVQKLQQFQSRLSPAEILAFIKGIALQEKTKTLTSISVKKGERLVFVKLEDVLYFEASEKYVIVNTTRKKYLSEISLTELNAKLPLNFIRVHKSFILNKEHVKDVQKYFNSRYSISMMDAARTVITTGRSFNAQVKEWLTN